MIRRPPRSTLFPYNDALPIYFADGRPIGEGSHEVAAPTALRRARVFEGITVHGEARSEEHTSELQSPDHLVCRLLLEKKNHQSRIATGVPGPLPPSETPSVCV